MKSQATKSMCVALPYFDEYGALCWGWTCCPDCGRSGAHHTEPNGLGVRCG